MLSEDVQGRTSNPPHQELEVDQSKTVHNKTLTGIVSPVESALKYYKIKA